MLDMSEAGIWTEKKKQHNNNNNKKHSSFAEDINIEFSLQFLDYLAQVFSTLSLIFWPNGL